MVEILLQYYSEQIEGGVFAIKNLLTSVSMRKYGYKCGCECGYECGCV